MSPTVHYLDTWLCAAQAFAWALQLPLLCILRRHEATHAATLVPSDRERDAAVEGAVEGTAAAALAGGPPGGLAAPLLEGQHTSQE